MTATDDMLLDTLALVPVSNHQTPVVPPHSQQNQQLQIVPISITQQPPHAQSAESVCVTHSSPTAESAATACANHSSPES
jgi:hypothetical protein